MQRHVFVIPTYDNSLGDAVRIGTAKTINEAVSLATEAGYVVIPEPGGGSLDTYDAEDAPHIYGYEPDGMGAFSVTVKPL